MDQMPSDMVVIASARGAADIALCLAALRGHGIHTFALDHHMTIQAAHWSQAMGGCRIAVPARQAPEAIALLAAIGAPSWRLGLSAFPLLVIAFLMAHVPPPDRGTTIFMSAARAPASQREKELPA